MTSRANIQLYNADCLPAMRLMADNEFDLAIVDPPYKNEFIIIASDNAGKVKRDGNLKTLNNNVPTKEYFDELKRVSKNQIIWGVNYYEIYLGASRIVWDKDNTGVYSDCELAYHSFSDVTRKFKWRWNGMLQQNMKDKQQRIHPTEKPIKLYEWLLNNYAKEGDKILDTHLGSGSIALACWDLGFDLTGYEIDKEYYDGAVKRLNNHKAQIQLF